MSKMTLRATVEPARRPSGARRAEWVLGRDARRSCSSCRCGSAVDSVQRFRFSSVARASQESLGTPASVVIAGAAGCPFDAPALGISSGGSCGTSADHASSKTLMCGGECLGGGSAWAIPPLREPEASIGDEFRGEARSTFRL